MRELRMKAFFGRGRFWIFVLFCLFRCLRRQKPTLDVSQAQATPLFFPLVDLRDNHFSWSCPNQLGRLARDLLLSTSPVLGLQTYTATTSDFLFKIWILGTKLRKALYQQSCLCSPALYFFKIFILFLKEKSFITLQGLASVSVS